MEQGRDTKNNRIVSRRVVWRYGGGRKGEEGGGSPRWLTAVTRQILPSLLVWQLHLDNYSFCSGKHDNLHKPAAGWGQPLVPDSWARLMQGTVWYSEKYTGTGPRALQRTTSALTTGAEPWFDLISDGATQVFAFYLSEFNIVGPNVSYFLFILDLWLFYISSTEKKTLKKKLSTWKELVLKKTIHSIIWDFSML